MQRQNRNRMPQNRFCIVLIQPDGYVHSAALAELAETLLYAFDALNLDFELNINQFSPDACNILLGAHLLDENTIRSLPENVIIYNSEQFVNDSVWISEAYLELLKKAVVWDYSRENIQRLAALGVDGIIYAPVGYMPQLTRIPVAKSDIDVLFYGQINERRQKILEALIHKGLRVEFLTDVYREARDQYIARAKVILNMHYYEQGVFESVRTSYLLANEKAIVSECNASDLMDNHMRDAVCAVPYDQLVDTCVMLVGDSQTRIDLARKGFDLFSGIKATDILRPLLNLPADDVSSGPPLPAILNLGSGKDWQDGYFNIDVVAAMRPDAVVDISDPLLFEKTFETVRFGRIALQPSLFEQIIANDVLEHIPDLRRAMTNCLALLKPGGRFYISVPYDLSLGAWQDPTHVRGFNENSWSYYTDWFWYMGWIECRFDLVKLSFRLSAYGEKLHAQGKTFSEILPVARAIESMQVELRKRYLQESEMKQLQPILHRPWDPVQEAVPD